MTAARSSSWVPAVIKINLIDDISFESDEELEETKCVKRLPNTVLTEENLKSYLSHHLERLFIDNHHWLRENFIDKIGRLSPNIRVSL